MHSSGTHNMIACQPYWFHDNHNFSALIIIILYYIKHNLLEYSDQSIKVYNIICAVNMIYLKSTIFNSCGCGKMVTVTMFDFDFPYMHLSQSTRLNSFIEIFLHSYWWHDNHNSSVLIIIILCLIGNHIVVGNFSDIIS